MTSSRETLSAGMKRSASGCGELSRKEDFYNWTICGGDKFSKVIFSCYYTSRGIKRLIGTSEYRIKSVPDPQINFGIKEIEGSAHLSRETFLRVDIKGFDFVLKYRIKEFDIEFCRKNSDIIKIKNIGQQFSSDVISEIEKLEEGDCFCFKNFIVFNECEMIDRRLKDAECFKHIKTIPQPQW